MNKKIAILALALCMVAAIAVTGTIAYFTDTDKANNVFTLGSLDIVQNEYQRKVDPENTGKPELEPFQDDKVLMPIVGSAQGEKDEYGMPTAANYVDKIVTVENKGKSAAWVRTFVLSPADMAFSTGSGANENMTESPLHGNIGNRFDITGEKSYNTGDWNTWYQWDWAGREVADDVTIDGIDYEVVVYYMFEPLEAGTESHAVITGYYLDNGIDCIADDEGNVINYIQRPVDANGVQDPTAEYKTLNGDFLDENGKLHVYCYTQAVQAAGFDNPWDAFTAAGWNNADGTANTQFVVDAF